METETQKMRVAIILPLVHVILGIIQPHPDLDGIALSDEMENILCHSSGLSH